MVTNLSAPCCSCLRAFCFGGKYCNIWIWNDIGRNCLLGHIKKIAKFLMRTLLAALPSSMIITLANRFKGDIQNNPNSFIHIIYWRKTFQILHRQFAGPSFNFLWELHYYIIVVTIYIRTSKTNFFFFLIQIHHFLHPSIAIFTFHFTHKRNFLFHYTTINRL